MHPLQYAPGQVLAGTVYRVVRHLATGGMGSVYDVVDVTVEKRYVLKTLHPQLVSREDLARRMRDEAKALGKLHHPNIVEVITAGITSDAVKMPFYVMERLNGQNLRVVLENNSALDITHAYRIAIAVADALDHAHENNIIHRDVKPENIFLHRNSDGTTMTKLLDFGIVRMLDRKASHTHGKFIGTLRYASPEQVLGNTLGPATDIYSLGVVLFEMLAGRGPFDDAGDAYAIGAAHANQVAPPVSRFVRVAPELDRLVARALAKNPEQRPRDCLAFASELRRLLADEEAAPRSATVMNVLSAAVPSTNPQPAAMEADTRAVDTRAAASSGKTAHGMIPPSGAGAGAPDGSAVSSVPTTEKDRHADHEDRGPVSPIAPTLAAANAPVRADVHVNVTPAPAPGPRKIDRSAPTRESAPIGWTQRLAQNDTRIDDGSDPSASAGANANANAMPNVAPALISATTGPFAGEARTRPPTAERGPFILIGIAAVLSILMVGGAVAVVSIKKPSAPATTMAPPPPTPTPTPTPTTPTAAPSPTESAATATATPPPPPPPVVASITPPPRSTTTAAGGSTTARGTAKPTPSSSGHAPSVKFDP